jgi:hypothetical protein
VDTLRIGLYNSGGTRVSADTSGIANTAFNAYTGYGLWANLNAAGSNSTRLVQRTGTNTTLFASGAHSNIVSAMPALGYTADTTYTLMLEIEHTSASSVTLTFTDSNGYSRTGTDTAGSFTSFDTFALFLGNGSSVTNYTVDNVQISVVPEPGSGLLAGLGGGALLLLRRGRHNRLPV